MSKPAAPKEPWGDMLKRIFFNGTNPLTDDGGGKIVGVGIKAGQEVIFSKIVRKFVRSDSKSWMNLAIFSLLTAAFDDGLGAWYGAHKSSQGFEDVRSSPGPCSVAWPSTTSCTRWRWASTTPCARSVSRSS